MLPVGVVYDAGSVMATTEITDAAIHATATATTMEFRLIEVPARLGPGCRVTGDARSTSPRHSTSLLGPPVVHAGQEAAATGMGRRCAEMMPGGMIPVVDPPVA